MFKVAKKMRNFKDNIKRWNKETFGNIFDSKRRIIEELKEIQGNIQSKGYEYVSRKEEYLNLIEMHDVITEEEIYWRQWSRKSFLKEGDMNTKFFHMTILKHRMVNKIYRLNVHGLFTNENKSIKREDMNFFSGLLQSEPNLDKDKQKEFLECIPKSISGDQNKKLTTIPTNDEITKVVYPFKGDKAPGPDGFPFLFFNTYQHIIQEDVFNCFKEFFRSRKSLRN